MKLLSKLFKKYPDFSIEIVFTERGEFSINYVPQKGQANQIDILESFSQYFVRSLFAIGKTPVSEYILDIFSSHIHSEYASIDIDNVFDDLGRLIEVDFNIRNHLKIDKVQIYFNKYQDGISTQRLEYYRKGVSTNRVLLNHAVWLAEITIPLSIFAFYIFLYHQFLKGSNKLNDILLDYMKLLFEQEEITTYYRFHSYRELVIFTDEYFNNIKNMSILRK